MAAASLQVARIPMAIKKRRFQQPSTPAGIALKAGGVVYPFAAIVGQEEMKLSLVFSVIDPHIGGVLIMGDRGTGKSTAVRGLADLLPLISKVQGCAYGCDPAQPVQWCDECQARSNGRRRLPKELGPVPVVELPLGATEDRVCGTLDMERALVEGAKSFEPGLLAKANRGFLYIDEVNLLEDHLVDLLLDVAASGRNVVEREGISVNHPARFVMAGSGNPEEGDLRPQLLDRFGLHARIATITDLDARVEIIERRNRFERSPEDFSHEWEDEQERLRSKIIRAKRQHAKIRVDRELLCRIAEICLTLKIDGHRGELTIARAAQALSAFEGRRRVTPADVRRVAAMSLRHRLRRDVLGEIDPDTRIQQAIDKVLPEN
jgi:magnesium chelatase subunit I